MKLPIIVIDRVILPGGTIRLSVSDDVSAIDGVDSIVIGYRRMSGEEINKVGVLAKIIGTVSLNEKMFIMARAAQRVRILNTDGDSVAEVELLKVAEAESARFADRLNQIRQSILDIFRGTNYYGLLKQLQTLDICDQFVNLLGDGVDNTVRLSVLNSLKIEDRLTLVENIIESHGSKFPLRNTQNQRAIIDSKLAQSGQRQNGRRYFSKSDSGDDGMDDQDELRQLIKRIQDAQLPESVHSQVMKEFKRMSKMQNVQAEFSVLRTWIETVLDLPWNQDKDDHLQDVDIAAAQKVLDRDHYGLDQVKRRILEYLAVRKLNKSVKGPIICLVGSPGVGKTSLGKSIAAALNRKFHRISLGGVRDVAEIKGHRRTYVGALPGLIIQALKQCKSKNPVILLDEIEKMGRDAFRGDPVSAMLEVLDYEQNNTFTDLYLGLPFDLSQVIFICTANTLDTAPAPLLDRMEVVRIAGYTLDEKLHIAQQYLLPKQLQANGLLKEDVEMSQSTLQDLCVNYTAEAGVRNLERKIAAICRHVAMKKAQSNNGDGTNFSAVNITPQMLTNILGPGRVEQDISSRLQVAGVSAGLAYTSDGSGALLFIECTAYRSSGPSGQLLLTGKLGDVMKESAQAALSWVRSYINSIRLSEQFSSIAHNRSSLLSLPQPDHVDIGSMHQANLHARNSSGQFQYPLDVHIHFPAAAVSKDGPSAGVAIAVALVSLFSGRVCRPDTAMTGEITLHGQVLPVGGVKEKLIAAHRCGVKRVIIPDQNSRDVVHEVPDRVKAGLDIVYAKSIVDVIKAAFPGSDSPVMINDTSDQSSQTSLQRSKL
ncbi:hypothetical protein MP228_011322 [Amoeboaphelidium protococcarum]|nr:hypothetical protein MP228_011322 [Amoeboaphelidium protococcarum]